MKSLEFKGKWVLVTGASSGLGQEMARQLAHVYKANIIIVARRLDKLNELKAELELAEGIQVKVIAADLSLPQDVERTMQECLTGQTLYAAILNAGVTYFGKHTDLPQKDFNSLLQINVISVVQMINQLIGYFDVPGKEGGILIVSSMAAFFPVPYQAVYSGTKGFILNFVNALSQEIKNPALSLTVYAPGGIATEMTAGEKFGDLKGFLMPVNQAAKEGLNALRTRKFNSIPGFTNKMMSLFSRFLPKKLIIGKMGKVYRKALEKAEKVGNGQ